MIGAKLLILVVCCVATINCFVVFGTPEWGTAYNTYCQHDLAAKQAYPQNCMDLKCICNNYDGVYKIYPTGSKHYKFDVYCDQTTAGGGWTLFQKRIDGLVDFYRNWESYKLGFGHVGGEHWLGFENLKSVLNQGANVMRVDVTDWNHVKKYTEYYNFFIGTEPQGYKLTAYSHIGSTFGLFSGNPLYSGNTHKFTTYDRKQVHPNESRNCAQDLYGAWWYGICDHTAANLNGRYYHDANAHSDGVFWSASHGKDYSQKTAEMKLRPRL